MLHKNVLTTERTETTENDTEYLNSLSGQIIDSSLYSPHSPVRHHPLYAGDPWKTKSKILAYGTMDCPDKPGNDGLVEEWNQEDAVVMSFSPQRTQSSRRLHRGKYA